MTKTVLSRRFTRSIGTWAAVVALASGGLAQSQLAGSLPDTQETAVELAVEIGPIDGITTAWHAAPAELALPAGTPLVLRASAPDGTSLRWRGVHGERDVAGTSEAFVQVTEPKQAVTWSALDANGATVSSGALLLHALEFLPGSGHVTVVPLVAPGTGSQDAVVVTPDAAHAAALDLRQGDLFVVVAPGQPVLFASSDAVGYDAPWEWRVDGEAVGLGALRLHTFTEPGEHLVSLGPPADHKSLSVSVREHTGTQPLALPPGAAFGVVTGVYWKTGGIGSAVARVEKVPLPNPCPASLGGAFFFYGPSATLQVTGASVVNGPSPEFTVSLGMLATQPGCGTHLYRIVFAGLGTTHPFTLKSPAVLWPPPMQAWKLQLGPMESKLVGGSITLKSLVSNCPTGTDIPVTVYVKIQGLDPISGFWKTFDTTSVDVVFTCS